ncbi:Qat anti-phage system associated protein QatB [Thioalkalivibrio sp. HK1]|uniref:Qat anti-phage system associated protein QatB n=1 Tax=Thioalkalivibrio sp. HK1 TaxID=1469245 RepID=UPI000686CD4C|nr:Qat anti-phage system associated protein QatB [Thioalkalivibrio sp. HK1]
MKKGVAHYIHKGLGGSGVAVRRFGSTIHIAGTLFDALSGALENELDTDVLSGCSVNEIMDMLVDVVCPIDGTLDDESSRDSIKKSLSDILKRFPNADLLNLSKEQRMFAVECYIARSVFNRFYLDLGKTIQEKAPSTNSGLSRVKDARDYIMQTVAAAFRRMVSDVSVFSGRKIREVAHNALNTAVSVFEEAL